MNRIAAACCLLVLGAASAHAGKKDKDKDKADPTAATSDAPTEPSDDEPAKKKKKPKELEIGGRVFVREQVSTLEGGPWIGALTLDSVRLNAAYEKKRVRAVIKIEGASGTVKLRDAISSSG